MNRVSIKKSVPEVYVKESRDFQLLCDLFDLVNSGVKFDIDTTTHLSDTQLCRDTMLQFLQEKLGLRLRNSVTDDTLRRILKCFPFIIRHKGTKRGIAEMVQLFLNIIYSDGSYHIEVENINNNLNRVTEGLGNYVVAIVTTVKNIKIRDIDILDDLLMYVIPAGYKIEYSTNISAREFESTTLSSDTVYITVFDEYEENRLRLKDDKEYEDTSIRDNLHSIGATVVNVSNKDADEDRYYTPFANKNTKFSELGFNRDHYEKNTNTYREGVITDVNTESNS